MPVTLSILGDILGLVFILSLIGIPIGLYIWLRARGTLGDPAGEAFE
jgi:hypothetical protein